MSGYFRLRQFGCFSRWGSFGLCSLFLRETIFWSVRFWFKLGRWQSQTLEINCDNAAFRETPGKVRGLR